MTLEQAILVPFFYYKLRLEKYQNYEDVNVDSYYGFDINHFHQIEINEEGIKKQKYLNPNNVLFT